MTECGIGCPCRQGGRQAGKSGIAKAFMDYALTKAAEQELRESALVFYDEDPTADLPDWLFEAPSVDRALPGIAPAPTVDSALVRHLDGSLWLVAWRGDGWSLPKPTFFSPALPLRCPVRVCSLEDGHTGDCFPSPIGFYGGGS